MIRAKHVKEEIEKAKQEIKTEEGKILVKLLEVIAKVVLDVRLNVVKVMEKLGVAKVEPRKPEDKVEEKK